MKKQMMNHKKTRREFKEELFLDMIEDSALPMLIVQTYISWKHAQHILDVWRLFGEPEHEKFRDDYNKNLKGRHLTGRTDIWNDYNKNLKGRQLTGRTDIWISFLLSQYLHLYEYKYVLTESVAMGDALAVAYAFLNKGKVK